EPTLQVVLDALKLTTFYKAFEITADVPYVYMQEFWVTISRHHSSLHFKLNGKRHTVNVDNFRDMLKICPKLLGKIFEEPPLEEEILSFIRDLGYTGEIKFLSDVNVNHMHQPWRLFATIINKCLSGKTTALEIIIEYFMAKDQAIPRRNKMFWHYARNDFMFTTIRVISKHQDTQTSAKGDKPAKKKQSETKSKGLTVLSEVALTEAEQMKIALERNKIQTHSSHASGSCADKGTGIKPGVLDVPTYETNDEKISWKSSDEEDDDEVSLNDDDNNDDDEDNDDDDDDVDNQDDDDQENDGQDDDDQDDVNEKTDSDNDGDDFVHPKLSNQDQEIRHNKEESDEEIQGTDAQQTNVQTTQVIEDTYVIITPVNPNGQQQSSSVSYGFISNMLNPSPDTCIDSIFNRNIESTSLIDVPVTTIPEPPLLSTTTLLPPPTPLITHLQQTPVPTLETAPSSSLQDLSNFGSLFSRNLSKLELKNILIDKMESNKSIHRSDAQKNLYKALVDAYESDKLILDTYGETVSFKRHRDEEDKDEEPSAGSNWGSKRRRARKELESTSSADESAQAEEPMQTAKDLEEYTHQEFKTGVTEDQPDEETSQLLDWFQKPTKPPTPDRDWNKTLPDAHGPVQP
ncbi:retrovirus-related pol polyprotein from transposon TNT 1-94, partial [Tanacetum coccineum]